MRRLLSACAVLLLVGAGCPLTSVPETAVPPTEEPSPMPAPEPAPGGPSAGGCRPTGCSGQVCADEDVITTCEYRPEYACYKDATCERQADGTCGWTPNGALTACLQASSSGGAEVQ